MRRNDTGLGAQREPIDRLRLPVLDNAELNADQLRHTERVREYVASEIEAGGGWISFERYMEIALYAPGLGYYSAGARKLGRGGDFITAPEVSPLFGSCVALQCADVLRDLGGGSILEIGAGSGRLSADVLSRLEALGSLPARYRILEISAELRERQRRTLEERVPHLGERLEWLDAPPTVGFDGILLANEVLDALPVARFRWQRARCEELGVSLGEGRFVWQAQPASAAMRVTCEVLAAAGGGWEDGYVSEFCPRLMIWAQEVTAALGTGLALWLDYGLPRAQYYFPQRRDGTLLCHFRHRAHDDPFLYPGLSDITAWVDFTALAEASQPAGFELAGFTTQAHFLAGMGVDREMRILAGADDIRYARLAMEARQLMMPGEMGERFKAMAWSRGVQLPLRGFELKDLRHSL
jgi:SAM-dependent MidA family methyltransferase